MKSIKKLLAVVLSLAMVLGSLSVTALGAENVAEVTIGGNTVGYTTIASAVSAAVGTTEAPVTESTIKLLADINLTARMNLRIGTGTTDQTTRTITFDANGKTITTTAANGFEIINKNTTLNITGNGNWVVNNVSSTAYYLTGNSGSTLNVLSGTFTGGKALSSGSVDLKIQGGVWNVNPTDKVPSGYVVTKTEGKDEWTVTADPDVAEVTIDGTTTGYPTIDAAIAAFNAGTGASQTLTLLADAIATTRIELAQGATSAGKEYTIDLAGFDFTGANNSILVRGYDTLNIVDTSADKGATFTVPGTSNAIFTCNKSVTAINVDLGTSKLAGGSGVNKWNSNSNPCPLSITTGKFTVNPEGKTTNEISYAENVWTVTPAAKTTSVKIDDGTAQAMTFDEAMAAAVACTSKAEVTLTADSVKKDAVTIIPADRTVTLDLAGYDLTNTFSGSTGTNARYFYVSAGSTLTIKDTPGTGSLTVNSGCIASGKLAFAQGTASAQATVNIQSGNYYGSSLFYRNAPTKDEQTQAVTNLGGKIAISGGWFENLPESDYCATGYGVATITEIEKADTPYTVTNTCKKVTYSKNAEEATGKVTESVDYYLDEYTLPIRQARTNQFKYTGYEFMGWSTNEFADPDVDTLVKASADLNWSDYSGDTIQFFAIWKKVDTSMWVCVKTGDATKGYASISAGLAAEDDITLIKNYKGRDTVTAAGTLNLNGYNIAPDTTGSGIVIKAAVTIKNEDAGTITVEGTEYNFGGEGKIQGTAQGTGGSIESGEGGDVKILSGTFIGDAPDNGTVLVCSKGGRFIIYGGTFEPSNPESEVSTYYAGNGTIIVAPETQSSVKMKGTFAKGTGNVWIQSGWFQEQQSAATFGTYNAKQGEFQEDPDKGLVATTQDATYPYQVGTAWTITYNYGTGTAPETANPNAVGTDDTTVYTLNNPTPAEGYTFTGYTDQNDNPVTTVQGSTLSDDLTITAHYEAISYDITYTNVPDGATNTNPTKYTIADAVSLVQLSNCHFRKWQEDGSDTPGWSAGRTGDVTIDAVIWAQHSITYSNIDYPGVTAPSQTTFYEDEAVTLENIDDRDNYVFNGWHTESNTGPAITGWAAGEKTADVEVYAGWTSKVAEVTIGETTTAYTSLSKAVEATLAAGEQAVTLKLIKSQKVDSRIEFRTGSTDYIRRNITIDLNSKTLSKNATMTGILLFNKNTTATITGGTIDCSTSAGAYFAVNNGATLKVTDGTFTGGASIKSGNGTVAISGGTWNIDPSECVNTEIFQVVEKDSKFIVYEAIAQVTVGETTTGYRYMKSATTAQSALNNVVDGSTLTLLKDASATYDFGSEMTFTLDKNGFTYDLDAKLKAADGYEITKELVAGETDVYTVAITEIVTEPKAEILPTVGGSVGATLGLTYFVQVTLPEGYTDIPTMEYTDPATNEPLSVEGDLVDGMVGTYSYTLSNIFVSYIANNIEVNVMAGDDVLDTANYSVLQYYDALATVKDQKAELMTLLANTALYGKLLQAYGGNGEPVDLSEYTWVNSSKTEDAPTATVARSRSGSEKTKLYGVSVNVTESAALKIYLGNANPKATTQDDTLNIPKGYSLEITVDGKPVQIDKDGKMVDKLTFNYEYKSATILTEKISPADYSKEIVISLKNTSGTEVAKIVYSVNNYFAVNVDDATVGNLVTAMYNYGTAYVAYATKQ